jgi:4-amino-4-deoxy-L-arabinose transferase-like glycosyltransferase
LFIHDKNIFTIRDTLEKKWGRWNFYFNPNFGDIRTNGFAPYILMMREVNFVYTMGTIVLLYIIVLMLTENMFMAGLLSSAITLNGLFVTTMLRATSDAHMIFFVLLSVYIMNTEFFKTGFHGFILLGISIGCAVSTKLTGSIIFLIYGCIEYTTIFFRQTNFFYAVKRFFIVCFVACTVWFVSNPGLYKNVLPGTLEYISFRNRQSMKLERYFPDVALTDVDSRVHATFCTLMNPLCATYSGALTMNVYINIILFIIGCIGLCVKIVQKDMRALSALLCILVIFTVNTAYLPLDSDRYYLLPVIAVYLIYAVGIAEVMSSIERSRKNTKNPTEYRVF